MNRSTNLRPTIHIHPTPALAGEAAARHVARLSAQAIAERGRFSVALSGGSLPKLIGPALTTEPLVLQIAWENWYVFWADERCVPHIHPDSNVRLAQEMLLEHVPVPSHQIFAVEADLSPADAASNYQTTLARVFQPSPEDLPHFDLILLGMGPDGHTASLFPGHALLTETRRWVVPIFDSPKPPPQRITFTLPLLNHARQVVFIATGDSKAAILPQVTSASSTLPAGMIHPVDGTVAWFVDEAAAGNLFQGDTD